MKTKRVLHINVENETITETTISCLEDMQALVGGLIERAAVFPNGDELYVNEEGLLEENPRWFMVKGGHQPYAGNGFIIGGPDSRGNNQPAISTVDQFKNNIVWGRI
jgi:hypothetical protein